MLIDENGKEVKSPTQILDDLSKIKLDSQKEKEKNSKELHDSIDKIEAERKAKENAPIENTIVSEATSTTKLTWDKSGISPVVESEEENDHTETSEPTIKNSNDSVSFKDITDKAKALEDIVDNVKPVEVPHIDKPKEHKDTHTLNKTNKDISVISLYKSDNHDARTSSIVDDCIKDIKDDKKDISDIKDDCKTFESDIKELFAACDKLHVTDSRIKNVLNKLRSNTNNIMTVLCVNIIVTLILAIIIVVLIISNINIKSEIKYIEENTTRDSISSYYNQEYNTNDTSNSSSSIAAQNDDIQDKYPNGIPTNSNSEESSSVSKTESSTDIEDAEDESTSSLEDSEDATENTDDTDAVALIENESMYYDILNTTTEKIVGTFENRVLTNMTSGDVSYSMDIVSSDGTVYNLKSGIIDRNDLDNNYASVKKEARQYDIISSIDDGLIDSNYQCEITLSKCECSDNKVRYMIDTYKGLGKKSN